MPKTYSYNRIIKHIKTYGIATQQELLDKFETTPQYLSNLTNSPSGIVKAPKFLMSAKGQYQFWTNEVLRSSEIKTLLRSLNYMTAAYQDTQNEKFRDYAIKITSKLVAVSLDLYLTMLLLDTKGPIIAPEGNSNSEAGEILIKLINQATRTGKPQQFPREFSND